MEGAVAFRNRYIEIFGQSGFVCCAVATSARADQASKVCLKGTRRVRDDPSLGRHSRMSFDCTIFGPVHT